ncbi:hypothetical protein M3922_004471 [Vibrio parahaemolyticus]|nr:hypothetical protein [Vibrio parahaemolyticus]
MASVALRSWGDETENKIVQGQINFGVHLLHPERSSGVYQQKICDDRLIIASVIEHGKYDWDEVKM